MTHIVVDKTKQESHHKWFQIIVIVVGSVPALSAGMLFGWSSPSIPRIVNDTINYNITLDEASYFTVLPPIGAVVSCLIFAKTIDIFGRKYSVLFIAIPQIISLILTAIATDVYVFYVARFITGIGDACMFSAVPTYVGEVASPDLRGTWGNAMTFFIYFGQFLINVIGSYTSITTAAYISVVIPIVFMCIFIFMPESPYFHIMKNREHEAEVTLQKLLAKKDVENELRQLKADVARQLSESGTWKDLFLIDSNRKALYAGVFLRVSQQMGGIGCFVVYSQYIFLKSGGDLPASASAMILMGLCATLNLFASYTLDKVGRRRSYFFSNLFSGFLLTTEAIYFYIEQYYPQIDISVVNWIPVAGMIGFMFCYSFGLGIVPTLMLGELFSTSIKGKGLAILNITFGILLAAVTKIFHLLDANIGLYAPFVMFAIMNFISTGLSLYFVPETKGKTLEEIQQELKGKKSKIAETQC